jgi:hypothetical protein
MGSVVRLGIHAGIDMATKLDKPLKLEIQVDGKPYMLTITPEGLKLVPKGRRKGQELTWSALVSGEAALATALNASLNR